MRLHPVIRITIRKRDFFSTIISKYHQKMLVIIKQGFLSGQYCSVYIGKIHTHIRMCWLKICEPSSTQFFLGNINNKLCAVCFYRRKMFIQKLKIINTFSPARRRSKKNLRTPNQGSRESVATVLDPLSKTSRMRDFYSIYSPALQAPSIIRY